MSNITKNPLSPVLFIPHGGGPMPLFENDEHKEMVEFLESVTNKLGQPRAIILISAHWEESQVTITGSESPELIYDYYGFPEEMYDIQYGARGNTELAKRIRSLLDKQNIESTIDYQRGFDHGMYVPLKIMYPEANIPCVQISLVKSLDSKLHIQIGKALSELRKENVLIIGSGFSFHNLKEFMSPSASSYDEKNEAFEEWLIETCSGNELNLEEREKRLINWSDAPFARYCHPREEHLLPLHVCYGIANSQARLVFDGTIIGKRSSAFLWEGP